MLYSRVLWEAHSLRMQIRLGPFQQPHRGPTVSGRVRKRGFYVHLKLNVEAERDRDREYKKGGKNAGRKKRKAIENLKRRSTHRL